MYRRIISVLLVSMLILPTAMLEKVSAAGASFVIEDSQNLTEGKNNVIPALESSIYADKKNAKTISWDLTQIDGSTVNTAKYTLSYYASNNVKMELTLDKTDNDNAEVGIKFIHDTDTNYTDSITNTLRIYSNVGTTSAVKNYMTLNDFLDSQGTGMPYTPIQDTYPKFNIKSNTGFSILYNNTIFHFLWRNGRFYLTSENFLQGVVYSLDLKYEMGGTTGTDSLNLFTGISESGIHSIPTAERNSGALMNTPDQSFYMDQNLIGLFDTGDLQINNGDNYPAVNTGFVFVFDMPKVLNPNTNVYEVYSGDYPLDFKMPIKITLDNEVNPKIELSLSDILKQNASDISVTTSVTNELDIIGNRILLKLENIPASSIYHLSKIEVISENNNINKSTTNIDKPKVFTFLNFEPIYLNGKFYMQVYPYEGFEGNYLLKSGDNLNQSVSQYSDGKSPILFPLDNITLDTAYTTRYQIFFDPLKPFDNNNYGTDIYSQVILFRPDLSNISVGIVNQFEIKEDYYLLPDPNVEGNQKAELLFNAVWDIGDVSLINKMLDLNNDEITLTYRIDKTLSIPSNKDDETTVTDVTMTITRVNGQVTVVYSGDGVLNGGVELKLGTRHDIETDRTYYEADVKLSKDAYYKNTDLGLETDFKYPNIYFMNVRPINVNGNDVVVSPSLFESVTLNDITKTQVLPPQNLSIYGITTQSKTDGDDIDEVSFKVKYDIPAAALKEYIEKNFKQPVAADEIEININLYITQDEAYLRDKFSKFSYDDRISNSYNVSYEENIVQDADGKYVNLAYFSDINGNTPLTAEGYSQPIDILRDNQIARLGKITLSKADIENILNGTFGSVLPIKIDGLDKNQRYYVTSDLDLIYNSTGVETEKYSIISNIVSALTIGDKEHIKENEKIPPAPVLQKKDVLLDRATIFWNKIKSIKSDGTEDIIEYEIIRLRDVQLDSAYLESRILFETFWNSLPDTEKAGFRTDAAKLYQYLNGEFSLTSEDEFSYSETVDLINFIDKTLYPNNLYFYYVRTVRIVDGERIYSSWSNISVTTNPVNPPINLKISGSKNISYDPLTEFLIEFDAPLTDITKLGTEFFLEYSLKEDDGEFGEPIRMDSRTLVANASNSSEEGYTHFIYKISGLNHGKNYVIRVRMVDKKGDASIYSNNASTRTNLDQQDYEDEKAKEDWIEFTKQEMEKEIKNPYWTASNNDSLLELIFKGDMFDGFIAGFPDSIVQLPSGTATDKIYYFPLSAIEALNQAKKGLRINDGDMEVVITSGFLKDHETLNSVMKGIDNKEFQDAYVKLIVSFKERNELIDGNPPLGKIAIVELEIIGTNQLTKTLDNMIYAALKEKIEAETTDGAYVDKILSSIKDGALSEELHQDVSQFISDLKSEFYKDITSAFGKILEEKFRVVKLNSQVIIVQKNLDDASGIKGHQKVSGVWQTVDVYEYNGSKGIYTSQLGEYAFTGYQLYIIGLDSMENADKIKKMIVQYELLDYFGKDAFSVHDNVTKYTVTGALARITGAKRGDDVIKHLQTKGISVNNRNLYNPINIQDGLYLSMKTYEIKTGTKLESIKITDHTTISKIAGIDSKNKLAVNTAFQTKIYTNKSLNPNDNLTIREFLQILLMLNM